MSALGTGDVALLLAAGAGAGAINAAAGGGSLLSFPALIATGLSPLAANVTNLAAQPRLRAVMVRRQGHAGHAPPAALHAAIGLTCIYGGYFGAGLGIVLLAVLGTLLHEDLQRLNALKGALSFVVGVVAAVAVAVFGPVHWDAALIVGAASVVGGYAGATLARRLDPAVLRWSIVIFGVAVAVWLALR
jgi:uncharacterized membrane protein YfcA